MGGSAVPVGLGARGRGAAVEAMCGSAAAAAAGLGPAEAPPSPFSSLAATRAGQRRPVRLQEAATRGPLPSQWRGPPPYLRVRGLSGRPIVSG